VSDKVSKLSASSAEGGGERCATDLRVWRRVARSVVSGEAESEAKKSSKESRQEGRREASKEEVVEVDFLRIWSESAVSEA
jgi:hypothetical protein